jgi:hypothetical protein
MARTITSRTVRPPLRIAAAVTVALAAALPAGAETVAPTLQFRIYAQTRIPLTDVLWTGSRFLYVENTTNEIYASGAKGRRIQHFASLPRVVEETRCRLSPGGHGFPAGYVYCHSPDGAIYRVGADGKSVIEFARLPAPTATDGALAFDTLGGFGYRMLAATGRSGSTSADGGTVYAIDADGHVTRLGDYPGPGATDEIAVAPRSFGSASRQLLIAVDGGSEGTLQAMDSSGRARTLVSLPGGPNPLVVVPQPNAHRPAKQPPAGLYVSDTTTRAVSFAPASLFAPFRGQVIVGSELEALFWIVRPTRTGFSALQLPTNFSGAHNLEGATYVR